MEPREKTAQSERVNDKQQNRNERERDTYIGNEKKKKDEESFRIKRCERVCMCTLQPERMYVQKGREARDREN